VRLHSTALKVLALGFLLNSSIAHAFDKQTYLGGGFGASNYDRGQTLGPIANVYAAYGISDSFDARLDLTSTWLKPIATEERRLEPSATEERRFLSSALLSCTYKLDVIQWIPWGGVGIGVHHLGGELAGPKRNSFEPGLSLLFGLDYAWSRAYGLSLAFGLHTMPFTQDSNPIALRFTTSILRFERRFGW